MFYSTTIFPLQEFLLIIFIATSLGTSNKLYTFEEDINCRALTQSFHQQKTIFLGRAKVRSYTDCARKCIRFNCEFTWITGINGEMKCELFSLSSNKTELNTGNSIEESHGISGASCHQFEQNSENNEDSLENDEYSKSINNITLPEIQWVVFMDTYDSTTQSKNHLKTRSGNNIVAKVVSLDIFGTYTVANIHHSILNIWRWRGSTIHSIEQNSDGFIKKDACIVLYLFNGNGKTQIVYVHPNGSSWETNTQAVHLQVLTQNVSEFSIVVETRASEESKSYTKSIISNLESGYKLYSFKSVEVNYNTVDVYMHYINHDLMRDTKLNSHVVPPWYSQYLHVFGKKRAWMLNKIGEANTTKINKLTNSLIVAASPYWRSLTNSGMTIAQRLNVFQQKAMLGHRFRVRVVNEFYDIENLNFVGDDVYFHLPQMISYNSIIQFDEKSMEIRSFVTMSGLKGECIHKLEDEDGNSFNEQFAPSNIEILTDRKNWTAVYSIFSNGVVESGSALWLSDELMSGKDANILLQWTSVNKFRVMTVQMTTIKHLDTDSILVTSENHVGWYLDHDDRGKLAMSSSCEKEKVLVKSNGEVQILVYNIHSRRDVVTLADSVKITWFVAS